MEERLHTELIKKIDGLKGFVESFDLSSLLNTVAMELRKRSFPDQEKSKLVSPAKQCFYLIGIIQQRLLHAFGETSNGRSLATNFRSK